MPRKAGKDLGTPFLHVMVQGVNKEYILSEITEFSKKEKIKIGDIFFDRNILIKLIDFLKNTCEIKYIEIRTFFGISRGMMDNLKIK